MKLFSIAAIGAVCAVLPLQAEVKELAGFVPDAKEYELIASCNPITYGQKGYAVDRSESLKGKLTRLGYYLKLVGKDGKTTRVFAAMDPFTQDPGAALVPDGEKTVFQQYVTNLEVISDSGKVKTGKFEKGNIEFWPNNYNGANAKNIPGATGKYDFGDTVNLPAIGYGSMQIHNFAAKETVLAFNSFRSGAGCDLGIGNCPTGHPDWTFARNQCKSAELLIVGKFENLKVVPAKPLDLKDAAVTGRTAEKKMVYAPGEKMTFNFTVSQQIPDSVLSVTRTGDDGKRETARLDAAKPMSFTTRLDKPGFVRIQALWLDKRGKTLSVNGRTLSFEGGAGVEIDKLKNETAEPADFDAFWANQKKKLAAVPLNSEMKKLKTVGKYEIYSVRAECAGPRPVTGYLFMPANAKPKSLPAMLLVQGYGTRIQSVPRGGWGNAIVLEINAHGYELGQNAAYYHKFLASIKSNGQGYVFDPKQNGSPETSYFNGMALRVLRALEFLKSLPQYNGNLTVSGGSQGGLQIVWAAALDHDVKVATPSITWCCDWNGQKAGRLGGWRPQYTPALAYYDAVNHAKRIPATCRVEITRAGLGDYTCPPSGLACLYNAIPGPKKIIWFQGSTHGFVPRNPEKFAFESKGK